MYTSYLQILNQIDDIKKGDIVYVISDILELTKVTRENGEKFDRDLFINTILEKVGPTGTILIPTFNWDFCGGKTFDYKKTVSRTGALGNAALKREDFLRTKHPLYSFAVWGKDAEYLYNMNTISSFGEDTPFEYMYQKEAKALVIGLIATAGLTFCHYIEQKVGVPYRYEKNFTADYIDENGVCSKKTFSMYVRDLEKDPQYINEFKPLSDILETLNISRTKIFNGIPFRTVYLRPVYEVEKIDILMNDSRSMYYYNGQSKK